MKTCIRCKVEKEIRFFYKNKRSRDGFSYHCKECASVEKKKWQSENPGQNAATKKAWRLANPEKTKSQRIENYQKNRDRDLASGRTYKANNKARLAELRYSQYWENPDESREKQLAYRRENPVKARVWRMTRIAMSKLSVPKWADHHEIENVYRLAERLMQATREIYEVDHIVPLQSKLVCGLHVAENLRAIKRSENRRKSNSHWPDMP